jgi:hypothetical protein
MLLDEKTLKAAGTATRLAKVTVTVVWRLLETGAVGQTHTTS